MLKCIIHAHLLIPDKVNYCLTSIHFLKVLKITRSLKTPVYTLSIFSYKVINIKSITV